ncbi:MAG: molybdopterin-guanine dinucleotide biosynthesis protein B [Candidatus Aminicenantes bacterium]|nr:MAG: molybdopterin-guanine dinucleotide biosynthesis protein B [Candidatus Aminicenantes bacterium]
MKVFSFAGWSGSGKTILITQLIEHFKQKNKKVIAVKHAPHKYYLEPESADTFKFLEAGADEVCLVGKNEMLHMRQITAKTNVITILKTQYANCDFLLLEGLHQNEIPLIEVFDSSKNNTLKYPTETLCAVVSDKPITTTVPNFNLTDINKISNFMEVYDE